MGVPGLEQNYQYGLYGQGGQIPFGGLTVSPRYTSQEQTTGKLSPYERIGTGEFSPSMEGGATGAIKGLSGVVGGKFDTMQKYGFNF